MPASIGGGGRFISPEGGGGSPFDAMLKGDGIGSRRGSQISMHSDRSMSMKWYVPRFNLGVSLIRSTVGYQVLQTICKKVESLWTASLVR